MLDDVDTILETLLVNGHSLAEVRAAVERRFYDLDDEPTQPASGPGNHTLAHLNDATVVRSPPTEGAPRVPGLPRYEDLGVLGRGGMGEVRRVRDRRLGRTLALKTLHAPAVSRPGLLARFLEEAQATAQLQHPGIVPVYDIGELPDGRLWFTMKEVSGRVLGDVIREVHEYSPRRWRMAPSGWTLRRLVEALRRVCEAVAYAHSRGVVHRDLKPTNVMVGEHGEVLVLDWGIAKVMGRPSALDRSEVEPVQTDRSVQDALKTLVGEISGTPAYMPPEQAWGKVDLIDARSDVYALGAVLYEVLSGKPPYAGESSNDVLERVRTQAPEPLMADLDALARGIDRLPADRNQRPLPPHGLVAICQRAMARDPDARFPSAAELATELADWLDGARRQEEARSIVARARTKGPEAASLRARAAALRTEAANLLGGIDGWRPAEDKSRGWALEDEADALERLAELAALEEEQLLHGSLTHAPELPEAHAALAARYREEHENAEAAREDTTRAETLLRQHLAALPDDRPDRRAHLAYLKGDGALTLVTDPPGASVDIYRYTIAHRRLVPILERSHGMTPLVAEKLPMGSYVCLLRHPDCEDVRYPVFIERQLHWHGVPPEGGAPAVVRLPAKGSVGPEDCFVAGGWFWSGGDPEAHNAGPRRKLWVDGFVMRRNPVTNREYLGFLNDLMTQGRAVDALRYAPRTLSGQGAEQGALNYGFDGRTFSLRPDVDGDVWEPDWPVLSVDWYGAVAFATWESKRTGQAWTLPSEFAWEKAARGVDGRFFPWGDRFDPSWACMNDSHAGRRLPARVAAFPVDESPYGVRGMAGNAVEWCSDVFSPAMPPSQQRVALWNAPPFSAENAHRACRGGSWYNAESDLRVSKRNHRAPTFRGADLGLRLMRPWSA